MSAITLFVLCCGIVQVQSITPYVFSTRTYYNVDSANGATAFLDDAVFHVRFNQPLGQIIGWTDTDTASVLPGITVYPSFANDMIAVGVPGSANMYGFDFTVRITGGVAFPAEASIGFKAKPGCFCKAVDVLGSACVQDGPMTNTLGSYMYSIAVGSSFLYNMDWNSQGVDQISALMTFNHMAFDSTATLQPLFFTIDGEAAPLTDEVFIAISDTQWLFNLENALPSSVVCLLPPTDLGPEMGVLGDYYGNELTVNSFTQATSRMCYTMPADPVCGDWSEWSDTCTFQGCVPIPEDEVFNVQSRSRTSAEFPDCNVPPEERICEVDPTFPPCTVQIAASEQGNECENTCDSGGPLPGVGCQCGGNCMQLGNCCQSYFSSCIGEEEATQNPIYFYQYAPCWTAATCTQEAPNPPETFACGLSSNQNGSGQCNTRPYNYRCYCGFSPASGLTCGNIGGSDLCCNGDDSYQANCLLL